jgi:hypothetical protein
MDSLVTLVTLDATITPFLRKLLFLLNDVPLSIGAWDKSGSVFIVYDGAAFEALSRNYFKGTLQTFIRQLHFYGFSKMDMPNLGINTWSFSHPYFLRDSPSLITEVKRRTGGGHITGPNVATMKSHGVIPTAILMIPKDESDSSPSRATKSGIEVKISTYRINELEENVEFLQDIVEQLFKFVDMSFAEGGNKKRSRDISVEEDEGRPKLSKTTSFESSSSFNDFVDSLSSTLTASPVVHVKEEKEDTYSSSTDEFMIDAFADEVGTPITQEDL